MAWVRVGLLFVLGVAPFVFARGDAPSPPNIVVILVDDLGFGDIRPGRMPKCTTLAEQGTRLNLYAHQNCMPSRAALFTGRYPHRYNLFAVWPTPIEPGLPTDETILSEHLSDAGYRCGMFGKWHLGWKQRAQWPTRRGFSEFVGFLGGFINSYGTQQDGFPYEDDSIGHDHHGMHDLQFNEVPFYSSKYSTHLFRDGALRFIERNAGSDPFFLYVPLNAPHGPFSAPQEYVDRVMGTGEFDPDLLNRLETVGGVLRANPSNAQDIHDVAKLLYAAMVLAIDDAVDAIYSKLQECGVADNTIFVFASDNGVSYTYNPSDQHRTKHPVGSSGPLRGMKGEPLEGGHRVANFVLWPDKISAGQEISSAIWIGDLTATFLDVAGISVPDNFDGASIVDAIETDEQVVRRHGPIVMPYIFKFAKRDFHRKDIAYAGKTVVIRRWRKYIRTIYWDADFERLPYLDEELYDLERDIGETNNRVGSGGQWPELLQRAKSEYKQLGGDAMFDDLEIIPGRFVWSGFVPTIDFGFEDDSPILQSNLVP